jgi:hypothetical protein
MNNVENFLRYPQPHVFVDNEYTGNHNQCKICTGGPTQVITRQNNRLDLDSRAVIDYTYLHTYPIRQPLDLKYYRAELSGIRLNVGWAGYQIGGLLLSSVADPVGFASAGDFATNLLLYAQSRPGLETAIYASPDLGVTYYYWDYPSSSFVTGGGHVHGPGINLNERIRWEIILLNQTTAYMRMENLSTPGQFFTEGEFDIATVFGNINKIGWFFIGEPYNDIRNPRYEIYEFWENFHQHRRLSA